MTMPARRHPMPTDLGQRIRDVMTREGLVTAPVGTTLEEAERQFLAAEALWTLDEQGLLGGVPVEDAEQHEVGAAREHVERELGHRRNDARPFGDDRAGVGLNRRSGVRNRVV